MEPNDFIRRHWPASELLECQRQMAPRANAGVAGDPDAPYEIVLRICNYDRLDTPLVDHRVEAVNGHGQIIASGWTNARGEIVVRVPDDTPTRVRVLGPRARLAGREE